MRPALPAPVAARAAGGADCGIDGGAGVLGLSGRRACLACAAGGGLRSGRRLELGRLARTSGSTRRASRRSSTAVVASAEVGAAEARPGAVRARARRSPACAAADAWHAGDSVTEDVEGARAAGIRPVLIAARPTRTSVASCSRGEHQTTLVRPAATWPGCRGSSPLRCAALMSSAPPPSADRPAPVPARPELPEGVWRPEPPPPQPAATRCRAGRCGRRSPAMLVHADRRGRRRRRDRADRRARRRRHERRRRPGVTIGGDLRPGPRADRLGAAARAAARPARRRRASSACG